MGDVEVREAFRDLVVREARAADMPAVQRIYAHQVSTGVATFEEVPPTAEVLLSRREDVRAQGLPYLVAERGGRLLGYCHAAPYRLRPAYRWTIEDSVYVSDEAQGQGVGSVLLTMLIAQCQVGLWRQMIAVIGDTGDHRSVTLHARLGFRRIGILEAVGFKGGRWVDTVIMQRPLGAGSTSPPGPGAPPDAER